MSYHCQVLGNPGDPTLHNSDFFILTPSTKRAITSMFFEQIEIFQCLKALSAQGPSPHIYQIHMAGVTCPIMCLKVKPLQISFDLFCNSNQVQFSCYILVNLSQILTAS